MTNGKLFTKDFTLVVVGQIISLFGNAILRFALPLYLLRQTGSPTLFGIVSACSFLPLIFMSLVGGVLADRLNKRNIMVVLDLTTAGVILAYYLLNGILPLVPLIIVFLMLLYGISGTYQPAVQASIPVLLDRALITKGNSIINSVSTLAGLLGPVIGGLLFGLWGLAPILMIGGGCFVASAVMEIFIRIPFDRPTERRGLFAVVGGDLKESVRFLRKDKPIFIRVVALLAVFNFVLSAVMIVGIPVMVVSVLGMGDLHLGIAQGALGLGGLAGGLLSGVLSEKLKLRSTYLILAVCALTAAVMGVALLPFVSAFPGYLLVCAAGFIAMATATMFTVQLCAAIQRQTPPCLIGKIMAFVLMIANCASPLGQALYGSLFDALSAVPFVILFAASAVGVLIALVSRRTFVKLDREESPHAAGGETPCE